MVGEIFVFGEDIEVEVEVVEEEDEAERSEAELKRSEAGDLLRDQVDEDAEHSVACSIVS